MTDDNESNKLDPRVTKVIEQSAEFLDDLLSDNDVDQLWAFSEGLDMFDRALVLQRAICMVVGFHVMVDRDVRDAIRVLDHLPPDNSKAEAIFLDLLRRFNAQDLPVSHNRVSRHYGPFLFAEQREAKQLPKDKRKRLLVRALDDLLRRQQVHIRPGPNNVRESKRVPCLYCGDGLRVAGGERR